MKKVTLIMLIALLVAGMGTATAQKKRSSSKKTAVAAKIDPSQYTGVWTLGYNSGYGDEAATVSDTLALSYDAATGAIIGTYKSESGVISKLTGKVSGNNVTIYDEAGDEFAGGKLYNKSTLKLDTFTGTFKRVSDTYSPLVDPAAAKPAAAAAAKPECDKCPDGNQAECKSAEPCDKCKEAQAGQPTKAASQQCETPKAEVSAVSEADKVAATKKAAEAVRKAAAAGRPVITP